MTTEELKKKIDGLFFGLHSTNPGDINPLPEILNAIADMAEAASTPKLIELSGLPTASMTTQAALDAIGITEAEIAAASNGERAGVGLSGEISNQFFSIEYASSPSLAGYQLVFRSSANRYNITSMLGSITVTITSLS